MNIAIIGATGMVGRRVLSEALSRGHQVTAVTRDAGRLKPEGALSVRAAAAGDRKALAAALKGHHTVVSAVNPGWGDPQLRENTVKTYRVIVDAAKDAGVSRLVVVGGAGTLDAAPGVFFVDTPAFPAQWKEGALGMRDVYLLLKKEEGLDWAFFAPAPLLEPGTRTGRYAFGGESLMPGPGGAPARVSVEDYAAALLDELERPSRHRVRFTVAST